ncbi:30S ribosomal protein S20 [Candidatus Gottesmanbacteria bacterium]|nr:30S ribosomal protein S20 [Candidatus Gottesmanbacteria bacterium]
MPITKQAIKKLRADRVRQVHNARIRVSLRDAIKSVRRRPSSKALSLVFQRLDKAAKRHVIHKNKVDRLKSRLSRLLHKTH